MVPHLEDMGIRMLLNESVSLEREGETIHLAGIDDAHYYRVDNLEKSAHNIPGDSVSILLSHTTGSLPPGCPYRLRRFALWTYTWWARFVCRAAIH